MGRCDFGTRKEEMGLDLPGIKVMADLYNRVAEVFSRRYECPFCQGKFKRFRPYGVNNPVLKNVMVEDIDLCDVPEVQIARQGQTLLFIPGDNRRYSRSKRKIRLLHIAPELN